MDVVIDHSVPHFEWIADRVPLPDHDKGKIPDIHSVRALGSSFYEIMGHARQGTNGKHYSKHIQSEGIDVVLAETRFPTFLLHPLPHYGRIWSPQHNADTSAAANGENMAEGGAQSFFLIH